MKIPYVSKYRISQLFSPLEYGFFVSHCIAVGGLLVSYASG